MEKKPRWTVEEVREFCGWDFLKKMIKSGSLTRTKLLFSSAFLTGGRINEVLQLERRHFLLDQDPNFIVVRAMPIIKRYKRTGRRVKWKCDGHCNMRWNEKPSNEDFERHKIVEYTGWETELKRGYRTFPIPKSEPLVPMFLRLLKKREGHLFSIKYDTAYRDTVSVGAKLGEHIPPHWFRAQRASQLAFEYGFNEHDLIEFFKWKHYETAFHYASKGYKGLAAKMDGGVQHLPRL